MFSTTERTMERAILQRPCPKWHTSCALVDCHVHLSIKSTKLQGVLLAFLFFNAKNDKAVPPQNTCLPSLHCGQTQQQTSNSQSSIIGSSPKMWRMKGRRPEGLSVPIGTRPKNTLLIVSVGGSIYCMHTGQITHICTSVWNMS